MLASPGPTRNDRRQRQENGETTAGRVFLKAKVWMRRPERLEPRPGLLEEVQPAWSGLDPGQPEHEKQADDRSQRRAAKTDRTEPARTSSGDQKSQHETRSDQA